jgi:hypothetical protein
MSMVPPFDSDDASLETAKQHKAWLEEKLSDGALPSDWRARYEIALETTNAYIRSLEAMDRFVFDAGDLPIEEWIDHGKVALKELTLIANETAQREAEGKIDPDAAVEIKAGLTKAVETLQDAFRAAAEQIDEMLDEDGEEENGS